MMSFCYLPHSTVITYETLLAHTLNYLDHGCMQISNCLAVDVNIINICANNVYSVNFTCNGIQYAVVTSVRGHVNMLISTFAYDLGSRRHFRPDYLFPLISVIFQRPSRL